MADEKEVKPDSPSMVQLAEHVATGHTGQVFLALSEKFALDFLNASRRWLDDPRPGPSMTQMVRDVQTGNTLNVMGTVTSRLADNFLAVAQRGASNLYTLPAATEETEAPAQTGGTTTVAPKGPGSKR